MLPAKDDGLLRKRNRGDAIVFAGGTPSSRNHFERPSTGTLPLPCCWLPTTAAGDGRDSVGHGTSASLTTSEGGRRGGGHSECIVPTNALCETTNIGTSAAAAIPRAAATFAQPQLDSECHRVLRTLLAEAAAAHASILVIDTETTGVTGKDEAIELCVAELHGGGGGPRDDDPAALLLASAVGSPTGLMFHRRIRPSTAVRRIHPKAQQCHGHKLETLRRDEESAGAVLRQLERFLSVVAPLRVETVERDRLRGSPPCEGYLIVGHNVEFDLRQLRRLLDSPHTRESSDDETARSAGTVSSRPSQPQLPFPRCHALAYGSASIDTLVLFRATFPGQQCDLDSCCRFVGVPHRNGAEGRGDVTKNESPRSSACCTTATGLPSSWGAAASTASDLSQPLHSAAEDVNMTVDLLRWLVALHDNSHGIDDKALPS